MKDSYKEDFYCFSDMKVTKNCIEKNLLMIIDNTLPDDNDVVLFLLMVIYTGRIKMEISLMKSIESGNIINQTIHMSGR